tara:strand:+ start:688 stop:1035 length:348 start_codon:yes stop_codon:yes gene_type:complete
MSSPNPRIEAFVNRAKKWQGETRKLRTILLECGLDEDFKHAAIELVKLVDAPTGLVNSGLRVVVDAESKSVLLSGNKDQVREGLALLARLDISDAEKARAKKLKQANKQQSGRSR